MPLEKQLVLIVDDNSQNCMLLGNMLSKEDYEIGIAEDGLQAIEFVKHEPPDLILLDIMMPKMDGFEVCKRLKQDQKTKHIPIIFLTARATVQDEAEAFNLGAVDYITKPFVKETVRARVRAHAQLKLYGDRLEELVEERTSKLKKTMFDLAYTKESAIVQRLEYQEKRQKMQNQLLQAQKMKAVGELAGGIAHDFNNILFPVVVLSELLTEDLPPGSQEHDNALEILKAGKRGSDLVKQILSFARQSEHKLTPVQVQRVLKEVLKLSRSVIPANIEISQDIQSDCAMVMADPTQLHQVAMNLIINALHAVEHTNGKISVGLKEILFQQEGEYQEDRFGISIDPDRYVMLSISDTGTGIDPAIMDKIFDPYFTTKGKNKGTGLGLAVAHGIIKEHGGYILVDSEPGKGTTFNIYLPLIEKSGKAASLEKVNVNPSGNEQILLVDDQEQIVQLEKLMLERLGYGVEFRTSSLDALEAFKANPDRFDLVITDMSMPNMTGDQLAMELTLVRQDIPIIICTGFSERINREIAETMGIKAFLMKPVVMSDLAKTIRKVLDAQGVAN